MDSLILSLPKLDELIKSLGSYAGRDKAIRVLYFYLQLRALKSEKSKEIMALAKQLSTTRLVLRQFNAPQQYKALLSLPQLYKNLDKFDFTCVSTVTVAYSFYWICELLAWLSDAKVLSYDSARLFRYCLYLWLTAITAGIIKQLREVYSKGIEKGKNDLVTLLGLSCDAISAVNALPHKGFLWAGKLPVRVTATSSLIASIVGWIKTF